MDAPQEPQTTPPRRPPGSLAELLHSWRYFFWVLGLILFVGGLYLEEDIRGKWAWERYQHRMAARGERIDPAAVVPPAVRPDQNFALTPFLAPLFEFIPGTQKWRDTNALERTRVFARRYDAAAGAFNPPKTVGSNSWLAAPVDLRAWYGAFLTSTNKGDKSAITSAATNVSFAEAAAGIMAGLSESDAVLDEIQTASQLPHSRFNIAYQNEDPAAILLPHLGVLKHLCQVLQLRACAELALRQTNDAFADLQLMLYLTDACREEPILVSQLVRMAQLQIALQPFALGIRQWSEPQLRALQERFQRFDFCADTRRTLAGERSFFGGQLIDFVRRSRNRFGLLSGLSGNEGGGMELAAALMVAAPDGWFYLERLNYNRIFEEQLLPSIELTNGHVYPVRALEAEARLAALGSNSAPVLFMRHRFFSRLLLPNLVKPVQKAAFAQTAVDSAAIACALERYRRAHAQYPDSLDALVPQYMEKLPNDIISGQPLKYRRTEDGQFVLYSIGWNEKDDGGVVGLTEDAKAAKLTAGDWVWRSQ